MITSGMMSSLRADWETPPEVFGPLKIERDVASAPLTAAAAERVKAMERVAEAARKLLMWQGQICPAFPEQTEPSCKTCGYNDVCAALAALDEGREHV